MDHFILFQIQVLYFTMNIKALINIWITIMTIDHIYGVGDEQIKGKMLEPKNNRCIMLV